MIGAPRKRVPYLLSNQRTGTKHERTQPNRSSRSVGESWRKRGHSTEKQGAGRSRGDGPPHSEAMAWTLGGIQASALTMNLDVVGNCTVASIIDRRARLAW